MKICTRCKIEKDDSGFGNSKNRKDGLSVYCKLCKSLEAKKYGSENREKCAEKLRKWREKNPQKSKEYSARDREKNHEKIAARRARPEAREKIRKLASEWVKKNKDRHRKNCKEWKNRNRLKTNAHSLIAKHLVREKLERPTQCEKCMTQCKPEAHHEDYNKPLDVQWLCRICHAQAHGKLLDLEPNA